MDPFIRTVVGKSPSFEQLKPFLPSDVDTFYELYAEDALPTFGAIDSGFAKVYKIISMNDLILNTYWRCRDSVEDVIRQYNELRAEPMTGDSFYSRRDELNSLIGAVTTARKQNLDYITDHYHNLDVRLAVLALYFNHAGLNGRVAPNRWGRVATQFDLKVNELPDLAPQLRQLNELFGRTYFRAQKANPLALNPMDQPFAFNWSRPTERDFVFINGYREKDQAELSRILRKMRMLSRLRILTMSYDTAAVRGLYNDFDMREIKVGKSKRLLCW